jgi:short-subunit dehydrogenase
VLALACDVGIRSEISRVVDTVRPELGRDSSGQQRGHNYSRSRRKSASRSVRRSDAHPYYAINAVLPQMKKRQFGRILNVASIGGKVAFPHLLAYSTSKFARVGLQ